jgi:hypothetical protein
LLYVQVFFIPDTHDRAWNVVVQNEARSHRVIQAFDPAILNGIGAYNPMEADCVNDDADIAEGVDDTAGDLVDAADVARAEIRFHRGEIARARAMVGGNMN